MKKNTSLTPIILILLLAAALGGYLYWQAEQEAMPDYIASGNGRIEAEETHVAAKYAGRVIDILFDEGDMVKKGDIIAHIDAADLEAQRNGARANLAAAQNAVAEAEAQITHREAEMDLAQAEEQRAKALVGRGVSKELYDQRVASVKTAKAALKVGTAQLASAENQVETAQSEIDRLSVLIGDAVLKAPMSGRVQYRLAEPGEVLSAGSRVVTILDLENVYMTIFLPAKDIGQIIVGSEARIILDAVPNLVIPAKVSFISSEAQFTPREVETREEREKLMFRVKIRVPKDLLAQHSEKVRTGLPGVGYVLLGEGHQWPDHLKVNIPQKPE